jgi:hypothetical protein
MESFMGVASWLDSPIIYPGGWAGSIDSDGEERIKREMMSKKAGKAQFLGGRVNQIGHFPSLAILPFIKHYEGFAMQPLE